MQEADSEVGVIAFQCRYDVVQVQTEAFHSVLVKRDTDHFFIAAEKINVGDSRKFQQTVFDGAFCQLTHLFQWKGALFCMKRVRNDRGRGRRYFDKLRILNRCRKCGAYLRESGTEFVQGIVNILVIFEFGPDHRDFVDGGGVNAPDTVDGVELLFGRHGDIGCNVLSRCSGRYDHDGDFRII